MIIHLKRPRFFKLIWALCIGGMVLITAASIFLQQVLSPRWLLEGFLGQRDVRLEVTQGLLRTDDEDVVAIGFSDYFARNRDLVLSPDMMRKQKIIQLEEVLIRASDSAALLTQLALLYEQEGDRQKANEYRDAAREIDPGLE